MSSSCSSSKVFTDHEWDLAYTIQNHDGAEGITNAIIEAYSTYGVSLNHLPDYQREDFYDAYVVTQSASSTVSPLLLIKRNGNITKMDDIVNLFRTVITRRARINDAALIHELLWSTEHLWDAVTRARVMTFLLTSGVSTGMMMDPPPFSPDGPNLPLYMHAMYFVYAPVDAESQYAAPIIAGMWKLMVEVPADGESSFKHFLNELSKSESSRKTKRTYKRSIMKVLGIADGIAPDMADKKFAFNALREQQRVHTSEVFRTSDKRRIKKHIKDHAYFSSSIDSLRLQTLARYRRFEDVEQFLKMSIRSPEALGMIQRSNLNDLPNRDPSIHYPEQYTSFIRELLKNKTIKATARDSGWKRAMKRVLEIIVALEASQLCFYAGRDHMYKSSPLLSFTITNYYELKNGARAVVKFYARFIKNDDRWLNEPVERFHYTSSDLHDRQRFTFGAFLMATLFYNDDTITSLLLNRFMFQPDRIRVMYEALQFAVASDKVVAMDDHPEYNIIGMPMTEKTLTLMREAERIYRDDPAILGLD